MKIRTGFISNSSTATFIISKFHTDPLVVRVQRLLLEQGENKFLISIKDVVRAMIKEMNIGSTSKIEKLNKLKNVPDDAKTIEFFHYENNIIVDFKEVILIEVCTNIVWKCFGKNYGGKSQFNILDDIPQECMEYLYDDMVKYIDIVKLKELSNYYEI